APVRGFLPRTPASKSLTPTFSSRALCPASAQHALPPRNTPSSAEPADHGCVQKRRSDGSDAVPIRGDSASVPADPGSRAEPSQAAAQVHDDELAFDSGIVVVGRRLAPERTLLGRIRGFARSIACLVPAWNRRTQRSHVCMRPL